MCLDKSGIRKEIPSDYSEICTKVFHKTAGGELRFPTFNKSRRLRKMTCPKYTDYSDYLIDSKDNSVCFYDSDGDESIYHTGFHAFTYGTDIRSYCLSASYIITRIVVLSDIVAIGYQSDYPLERVVVGRTMYIVPTKDEVMFRNLAHYQKRLEPKAL